MLELGLACAAEVPTLVIIDGKCTLLHVILL